MQNESTPTHSGRSAAIVLGLVFGLAIVLGVIAFWRYKVSERHIHDTMEQLATRGAELSAEGCVTAVLDWHSHCLAMQSLCDHSVPMAMMRCLGAADRSEFCAAVDAELGPDGKVAKYTFAHCGDRSVSRKDGAPRSTVKACGYAYSSIVSFCDNGQRGVVL